MEGCEEYEYLGNKRSSEPNRKHAGQKAQNNVVILNF